MPRSEKKKCNRAKMQSCTLEESHCPLFATSTLPPSRHRHAALSDFGTLQILSLFGARMTILSLFQIK